MTAYERLDLLFQQNNGILKTAQVLEKRHCQVCVFMPMQNSAAWNRPRTAFMFRLTHGRMPCTCCTFAARRPYSPMRAHCFP